MQHTYVHVHACQMHVHVHARDRRACANTTVTTQLLRALTYRDTQLNYHIIETRTQFHAYPNNIIHTYIRM